MVHSAFHFMLVHFLLINASITSPQPSIGNNIKQKNEKIPEYIIHLEVFSLEPFIKHKPLFSEELMRIKLTKNKHCGDNVKLTVKRLSFDS